MNITGLEVDCYYPDLEELEFSGVVVGVSPDTVGDAMLVVLKDDGTFGQSFVGYCKKRTTEKA